MKWARTFPGLLHTRIAMIHMIYLAHLGNSDGRDPASLWKFVKMLGHTEITAKCPNLNAAHDLLTQASKAHVLAALIAWCGVTDLNLLRDTVTSGRWHTLVEEMVTDWLHLNFVDGLRSKAASEAIRSLQDQHDVTPGARVRHKKPTKSSIESETLRH